MPKKLKTLVDEVLVEMTRADVRSTAQIDAKVESLHRNFDYLRSIATERRAVVGSIAKLPVEQQDWLAGVQASVKIVVGRARNAAHILVGAVAELLPAGPGAWTFSAPSALATRGVEGHRRVECHDPQSGVSWIVFIYDAGPQIRLVTEVNEFPAARPPVAQLLVRLSGDPFAVEVKPEVMSETTGANPLRRLRYEAFVEPGDYAVFFKAARESR